MLISLTFENIILVLFVLILPLYQLSVQLQLWPIQPIIISIEGNIGSGKTTLLNELKKVFNMSQIVFINEPVSEWTQIVDTTGKSILELFYEDSARYAFSFQMLAGFTRLANLELALKNNPKARVFITERSLETDRSVFAKMLYESEDIDDISMQIYIKWYKSFAVKHKINKIIYVKTDADICHARIVKRSRIGEDTIPLNYLIECGVYHDTMINNTSNTETIVLDGNIDIYENDEQLNLWIGEIAKLIN